MKCIIFGGSGEVGRAVTHELIQSDVCSHLTMLVRRLIPSFENEAKVEQIVVNSSAANFEDVVKKKALGHEVAISCIGIGSGTLSMSEEQMMEIEVTMLGKYARGCKSAGIEIFELLTAVGMDETRIDSKVKEFRVMGNKHQTVLEVGFKKLAIFKPGMIVGNKHTPSWVTVFTRFIPDSLGWGNIQQEDVARAFVAHLEKKVTFQNKLVVSYGNKEMKRLVQD